MIKAWRHFWDNLLNNEAYFIARVRAAVMAVAAGGTAFAHETADALGLPGSERYFKIAGVLCMAVSVLMRAGDKTPENVKEMANAADGVPRA